MAMIYFLPLGKYNVDVNLEDNNKAERRKQQGCKSAKQPTGLKVKSQICC
jgi:hypothetical protein